MKLTYEDVLVIEVLSSLHTGPPASRRLTDGRLARPCSARRDAAPTAAETAAVRWMRFAYPCATPLLPDFELRIKTLFA